MTSSTLRSYKTVMSDADEDLHHKLRAIAPGRSCIACRRRKIRCDRGIPCGYCKKLKATCCYPESEHSGKRQPDNDIVARLERIEALLNRLDIQSSPLVQVPPARVLQEPESVDEVAASRDEQLGESSATANGRLLAENEELRYVDGGFWIKLDEEDSGEDPYPSEKSDNELVCADGPGLICPTLHGISYTNLHPDPHQIFSLWQQFMDNVDPLIKIVHVPTTQRDLLQASLSLQDVSPSFESLMFAIYYAAVSSMPQYPNGVDRRDALRRYRTGLKHALARSKFMNRPDLQSVQALTLYLICARPDADRTYVWSMTGLVIRLATKLGLHQDPATHGLKPYIAEMRRRLWWQIVILDVLTAEESDMDPALREQDFDTKMPSNVNDQDLDESVWKPVLSQNRWTEMIFALQRIEISYAARKILFSAKFTADNGYRAMSVDDKGSFLKDLHHALQQKYHSLGDPNVALCTLTIKAADLVLSRMKLTVRSSTSDTPSVLSLGLVRTCVGIVDGMQYLRSDERHKKWTWLFQRYVEWDAVALLLKGLIDLRCEHTDDIWHPVQRFWAYWEHQVPPGSIRQRWRILQSLKRKAEGLKPSQSRPVAQKLASDHLNLPSQTAAQPFGTSASSAQEATMPQEILNLWQPSERLVQSNTSDTDIIMNSTGHRDQIFAVDGSTELESHGWRMAEETTQDLLYNPHWNVEVDNFYLSGW
jgi:hypothetical protein